MGERCPLPDRHLLGESLGHPEPVRRLRTPRLINDRFQDAPRLRPPGPGGEPAPLSQTIVSKSTPHEVA